jgi:hypothetical protein
VLLIVGGALQRCGEGTVDLLVLCGIRHPAVSGDFGPGVAGLDDDHADAERRTSKRGDSVIPSGANLDALYNGW